MYNFQTITVDYVPGRMKREPTYKPLIWVVVGSLFGMWVAGLTLLGNGHDDVSLWFGIVLYSVIGALFGYTCYRYVYHRVLQKFLFVQTNESLRLTLSLPVDWVLPTVHALTYVETGVEANTYQMTDPYGQVWDIVDRFQSTENLTLFLRQPVKI